MRKVLGKGRKRRLSAHQRPLPSLASDTTNLQDLIREFQTLWDKELADAPMMRSQKYEWVLDYGRFLEEREREEFTSARDHFGSDLFVFEVALQWLAYFHLGMEELAKKKRKWASIVSLLVGNAHIYGAAIRRLVLAGFDSPARALLRSLIEILDLALLVLDDPELGTAWTSNLEFSEARAFWRKQLTSAKVLKRLNDIDRRFSVPEEISREFTNWRNGLRQDYSQAVHPSPLAVFLSLHPATLAPDDFAASGLFGRASRFSFRTLRDSSRWIWYFSLRAIALLGQDTTENLLKKLPNDLKPSIYIAQKVLQMYINRGWDEDKT